MMRQVTAGVGSGPGVILSSGNIAHYHHAALALLNAGYLKNYLCSFGLQPDDSKIDRLLPRHWRNKLRGRQFPGIPAASVKTLPWPEIVARMLAQTKVVSMPRAYWMFNHVYDWKTRAWVEGAEVFHFVNGVGLYSARKVKKAGGLVICDVRIPHPDHQSQLVLEEYEYLSLPTQSRGSLFAQRAKDEYALADYLIVPSEYARNTFAQAGFSPSKIRVLPYGMDQQRFSSCGGKVEQAYNQDVFRVLYVGRIAPGKGVHYLIDAFGRMGLPDGELWLIGHVDDTMQGFIHQSALHNPAIRVLGRVPHVELPAYYRSGTVFVLPSVSEGSALVVYEAMASGLPTIVTTNAGARIRDGIDGFVVPIREVDALQEKLFWLYEHPQKRREFGQAARLRAESFTWQDYGERLVRIYDGILYKQGNGGVSH
jgi:glycosyltransferase involved in cell wall biosynthesis